jgi:hypothetical protein
MSVTDLGWTNGKIFRVHQFRFVSDSRKTVKSGQMQRDARSTAATLYRYSANTRQNEAG